MTLSHFRRAKEAISAAEVKQLTGKNYRFMGTMFGIDAESGTSLLKRLSLSPDGAGA